MLDGPTLRVPLETGVIVGVPAGASRGEGAATGVDAVHHAGIVVSVTVTVEASGSSLVQSIRDKDGI